MKIGNLGWQGSGAKIVSAASRGDQQKGLLQERREVRPVQFSGRTRPEDESKNSYPDDFADYVVNLHS